MYEVVRPMLMLMLSMLSRLSVLSMLSMWWDSKVVGFESREDGREAGGGKAREGKRGRSQAVLKG